MFGGSDRKELAKYLTLSQVGLEMVVPIGIGVLVDRYLHCSPWGAGIGAALGLTIGLVHLVKVANKNDSSRPAGGTSEGP
jgi:F0F1-type ATP synthase assembly protein I